MITLTTERLTLRGWRDDDLDVLAAMNADPEVMRYIMDGSVLDREQSAARLRKWRAHWDEHGYGLFAAELRETGELLGWAGFAIPEFLPEVLPAVEIGWRFTRASWGHGYATEAARAALRFGFADVGLDRVVSIREIGNARSGRVMDKLGMERLFDTVVPVHEQPVTVHAITRDQFLRTIGGGFAPGPARRVFGAAAGHYDAGRPAYHAGMVGDVLEYAGPGRRTAVEVGAGTGKATVAFAAAGVAVHCVEPDPQMAEVLRANVAGYPAVEVEVRDFEDWSPGARRFDLLIAATSWHWVDRERRWDLALGAVEPGGVIALCWNPLGVADPELNAELARVERRHGIVDRSHATPASAFGERPGDWDTDGLWPAAEIAADGRFTDLRELRYRDEVRYPAESYLHLLDSTSAYRLLEPAVRESALAAVAAVLGDGIDLVLITDLCLARKAQSATNR